MNKHIKEIQAQNRDKLIEELAESFSNVLLGEKIPLDIVNSETGEIIVPANRKVTKTLIRLMVTYYDHIDIDPSPIRNKIMEIIDAFEKRLTKLL